MFRPMLALSAAIVLSSTSNAVRSQELKYPQTVHVRYEAIDPRAGGHFLIWFEREKIWYGLDPRLHPAKLVDVTHVTPSAGSNAITMISVTHINSSVPDYFHISGNVRIKVSGMRIVSGNVPPP